MMDDPDTDLWYTDSTTSLSSSLNLNFRKSSLSPPRESPSFSRSATDNTYNNKSSSIKQQSKILKSSTLPSTSLSSSTISQSSTTLPSTSSINHASGTIIPTTTPNSCPSPSKIVKFMVREKGESSEPTILPLGINTSNNMTASTSTDQNNKSKGQLPPPVLLKTMDVQTITQMEDYLHCVKCYKTFYKLETLVLHFKTCPGKPNGSFEEFMRKKRSDSIYDYDLPSITSQKSQKHNSSISLPPPAPPSSSSQSGGGFTRLQDDDFDNNDDDMDYTDDFSMFNSSTSILNEINMRNTWKSSTSSSTNSNVKSSNNISNSNAPVRMPTRNPDIDTDMVDIDSPHVFPSPLIASFLSNIKETKKNPNQQNNNSHSMSPSLYKNIKVNKPETEPLTSITMSKKNLKGQVPHTRPYIITNPSRPTPSTSSLVLKVGKKGQIISSSASEVKTYTPRKEDDEVRNTLTPFSCSHCPFITGRNIDLLEHYEFKHPHIKVFKCPVVSCRESFLQESELKIHAAVHEPKPAPIPVKSSHMCQHCRKLFISKEFLNSHTLRVHSNKNPENTAKGTVSRPFACGFFPCQRTYTTLTKLKQHEKVHCDTKLHVCNVCKKTFTFKQVYVDHLRTHSVPSNTDVNKTSSTSSPSTSTVTPTTTTMIEKNSQLQIQQQITQPVQIQQAISQQQQQPSASLVAAVNKVNPSILKNRFIKVIRVRGNANMPNILTSSSGGTKTLVNVLSTNKSTTTTNSTTSTPVDPTTTTSSTTTETEMAETTDENPNSQENEIDTQDITIENSQDFMKDFSSELNNNDSNNESGSNDDNIIGDDSSQMETQDLNQSGEGEEEGTQSTTLDSNLEQVENDEIVNKL